MKQKGQFVTGKCGGSQFLSFLGERIQPRDNLIKSAESFTKETVYTLREEQDGLAGKQQQ